MQKGVDKILKRSPGIKAKDIAKELDLDRTKINAFLHEMPELYFKDEEYLWYRLCDVRMHIATNAVWINGNHVESALAKFGSPFKTPCKKLLIEIEKDHSILFDGAAKILAIANQAVNSGKSVQLKFGSKEMHSYLARAHFFDRLHESVIVIPARPQKSSLAGGTIKLVEFHEIGGPFDTNVAKKIRNSIEQNAADQQINVNAVQYAISELVSNVQEHSQTSYPGFAGLQCYGGNRPNLMMVVSDNGLGICGTLRPILSTKYPHLAKEFDVSDPESDPNLLIRAFTQGGISRVEDDDRGTGLRTSSRQAATLNAKVLIRQENFEVMLKYRDGTLQETRSKLNLPSLPGTHVVFNFYLTKPQTSA
jgi:hypothetical protein